MLFSAPGFWDNGEVNYSTACDIVLTNQRVMGYYYKSFPREHLFLDSLNLDKLTRVEFRQKSYEPLFRELLLSDGEHKVYLRTTRRHAEKLYELLHARANIEDESAAGEGTSTEEAEHPRQETRYERQEVRTSFESSSLGITLLFVGGLILEIIGVLFIQKLGISIGLPLCIAGLVAVITALAVRRQRTRR
ncbi:hypothetical protein KSX_33930 [Ktedonospora formicarum]|uniref:Uncharacterized protein n=1 Tax=Ktedonospora formicarum TaxID=2778364 RepID=A0A8J3MUB1_9CHLR|nr:hypothetical protein KSX_33930 [Ktedonospora formicarum]